MYIQTKILKLIKSFQFFKTHYSLFSLIALNISIQDGL